MQIELLLDPQGRNYADFIEDLKVELRALDGLQYKQIDAPAPPKTLNVEHDIVKLVFEHGADALRMVVVLLQLAQAVAERRSNPKDGTKGKEVTKPVAVLKVDDRSVGFPASDRAQRNLLDAVRKGKTKKALRKTKVTRKKPVRASRKKTRRA